jgi:hypothetical protein
MEKSPQTYCPLTVRLLLTVEFGSSAFRFVAVERELSMSDGSCVVAANFQNLYSSWFFVPDSAL